MTFAHEHNWGENSAVDAVWGLVSGLRTDLQLKRRFFMAEAYFDESQKDGLFVMAGYLSNVEHWANFTKEWQEKLGLIKAEAFKMSKMNKTAKYRRLSGEFYKIIETNVLISVCCVINTHELRAAVDNMEILKYLDPEILEARKKQLRNPYFIAFKSVIRGLLQRREEFNIRESVDFVFDDLTEKRFLMDGWIDFEKTCPREVRKLIGSSPRWADEKKVLPLQSADLWAYWVRDWEQKGIPWQHKFPFPWGDKRVIPGLYQVVDVKGMIADIDRQIKTNPEFIASLGA